MGLTIKFLKFYSLTSSTHKKFMPEIFKLNDRTATIVFLAVASVVDVAAAVVVVAADVVVVVVVAVVTVAVDVVVAVLLLLLLLLLFLVLT